MLTPGDQPIMTMLLRTWAAARRSGENPVPAMQGKLSASASPELAAALDSLFGLTEAVLGRALAPGRATCPTASPDEEALAMLIRHARAAGPVRTGEAVPHGLPGALCWAAAAVARALGDPVRHERPPPSRCPFGSPRLAA